MGPFSQCSLCAPHLNIQILNVLYHCSTAMADKVRDNFQFARQKEKYAGVGSADTTREEFVTNIQRETLASLAMHENLLMYNSIATNTHPSLMKQQLIKRMIHPSKNDTR